MAGLAKVFLVGNLGRDPETRYTPSGAMNVWFSMAVTRRWTDQSGQPQERTVWFNVTAWRRLAETLNSLAESGAVAKGRQVAVVGTIEPPRVYVDRNGQSQASLNVTAEEFQLLGSRAEGDQGFSAGPARTGAERREEDGEAFNQDIDDVPF